MGIDSKIQSVNIQFQSKRIYQYVKKTKTVHAFLSENQCSCD